MIYFGSESLCLADPAFGEADTAPFPERFVLVRRIVDEPFHFLKI